MWHDGAGEREISMHPDETMEPITIRTAKEVVSRIDALAVATHRSRDDVVDQALRQFLETNTWQTARIEEGLAAAQDGRVRLADDVLAEIATITEPPPASQAAPSPARSPTASPTFQSNAPGRSTRW
jgi:predicted transcriptional regulator